MKNCNKLSERGERNLKEYSVELPGDFEIQVDKTPVTLRIGQAGYFSQQLLVEQAVSTAQQVMLIPAVFDLDPVIVTDRESVEDIMRRFLTLVRPPGAAPA